MFMYTNKFSSNAIEYNNKDRRINSNIFKVEDESPNVKSLLSMAVSASKLNCKTDKYKQLCYDISFQSRHTKRRDLIRTLLLLATSRNESAKTILIEIINLRIGAIKEKEYIAIAKVLRKKEDCLANHINEFLCYNVNGYNELHNKHYIKMYEF